MGRMIPVRFIVLVYCADYINIWEKRKLQTVQYLKKKIKILLQTFLIYSCVVNIKNKNIRVDKMNKIFN